MTKEEQIKQIASLLETNGGMSGSRREIYPGMTLREWNKKATRRAIEAGELKPLRESLLRKTGLDIADKVNFPVHEPGFSWRKMRERLTLREADSASTFSQFLRAGIQTIVNSMYETVQSTYEDWVTVIPSNKDTELYAPNHGVSFPRKVGPQMPYPQVGAAALDLKLKNEKFGSMYEVEKELLEDDQTGSFQRQAAQLGEYLKLLSEVYVYGKLASVAGMKYIDLEIPQSETQPSYESAYPWSTALRGGGANRPGSYGGLTQTNIQNGIIGLMNQKNLQGIKMQVSPTRLLIAPTYSFDAAVLIHSSYYPSGAAAAGNVGGAFAINPLKSILDITVSRYVAKNDGTFNGDSKAWYIVDDTKPWFVLQLREAVSLEQENPSSGKSFEMDLRRWKASTRQNCDHVDPRFAWQGNDGSV